MIELEGMTELILYVVFMAAGAVAAIVVPYLLNAWVDPSIKANWKYVGVLIFGIVVAVFFAAPSKVDVIDIDTIKIAILAGYGLQAAVNKVVKSVLEKKASDEPQTN